MTILRSETIETDIKVGDLRIPKANLSLLQIPLTEPFRISLGTVFDYSGTILEFNSDGEKGYGEGSTIQEITGEVPSSVYDTVLQILKGLRGNKYIGVEDFLDDVYKSVYYNPTAKNAIDTALHDLITKHLGVHLTNFLGGGIKSIPTSLTIGLGSVEENLKSLEELKKMNARIVKVKVGKNAELDVKRIRAISENIDGRPFFADANQGYKLKDATKVADALRDAGAIFFEQPMDRHNLQDIRLLRRKSDIPIMLDESISEPFDVISSILNESADLINVKLTKSGGIRKAIKTLVTAQAYGIDAMVGCMIESKLGIAASLSVASSLSNVKYTDLDGFHSLTKQPFDGGLQYESGLNTPTPGTGLACIPVRGRW
ncbi:MAG: dipeptide epimerase [Thermoplasmatales archaeon]